MDPNSNTDNTDLGLEPENNQLMPQPSERTDLADDEKLSQFFGRTLSDGQQETPSAHGDNYDAGTEGVGTDEAEAVSEEHEGDGSMNQQEVPKGVTKRISKLNAQRKAAEEKAKQLEDELESLKRQQAAPPAVNTNNPFGVLDTESKLEAEYERQREIRLFCERYPDGYYEDGQEPIDKEQIAKAKVNALRAIEDLLPKQMDYVKKSKAYKAAARKEFPWLDDPTDNRSITAKKFIEAVPQIRNFPDYEIYAAHLANGMVSYTQQKKAARNGTVAQRVPVQPTSTYAPTSAARQPDAVKGAEAANRYRRSASLDDLADVFKNKFV